MVLVKSVELDIGVKGDAEAKAKLDEISRRAEALKKAFPTYALKIDSAAASERLRVFRLQLAEAAKTVTANVKVKVDDSELQKLADKLKKAGGGPSWLAPALALTPAIATVGGVGAGAAIGLAGAFTAGAGALAAFGAVAKPVLTSALTASQAVNTAQNTYNATIAAGVPKAQALASLQTANANAQLTYNAALAGGAKPATALAAYHLALAKNQLAYNSATNAGTFNAKAYAAEQLAISKAYADLSPAQIALSRQLGVMANAWQDLKAAQTPVVAGALVPWLKSVTDLTKNLGPIIAYVSPWIASLGRQFDALIRSPAFTAFRDFIAGTGSAAVGVIGGTLIDFLKAGMILLVDFNPLIEKTIQWIGGLGPAVLKWAGSKKTADDITRFMAWFTTNGPVVGDLLKNIGKALAALAPGLTAGGAAELKVISDFFGWVAKLPKGIAAPLAEVAGALLLLNKLGVFSVGVKIVGAAVGWVQKLLGGATVDVGGAAAAAEIRAAMVSGGAAAAAEIRAAMAGGGATAGAGGAAGGAAKGAGGAGGAFALPGAAAGLVFAGAFIGAAIRWLGEKLSPTGTFAGSLSKMFQGLSGPISTSVFHAFTFGGLEGWFTAKFGIPLGAAIQSTGKLIQNQWATIWSNTIGGAVQDWQRLVSVFDQGRHSTANVFDGIRHDSAAKWDQIWADTGAKVTSGIARVASWFAGLPGKVVGALSALGGDLQAIGRAALGALQAGATSAWTNVASWFRGLPGKVVGAVAALLGDMEAIGKAALGALEAGAQSAVGGIVNFFTSFAHGIVQVFKNIWGWFSPSSVMYEGGKSLMQGLAGGIKDHAHLAISHAQAVANAVAAGAVAGGGGGPVGADAAAAQNYARSRLGAYGWSVDQMLPLISLWNQESGWNRFAYNASSGATGIPQALPYTKMPRAAWLPSQGGSASAGAQIDWGLGYIKGRYGSPAGAWGHEVGFNWYAGGTPAALPGWAWVGERGPELVKFRGGEQVGPVRPAQVTPPAGRGGTAPVIFEIAGGGAPGTFDAFLLKWLQEHVRVRGGGSAQKAFGHPGVK